MDVDTGTIVPTLICVGMGMLLIGSWGLMLWQAKEVTDEFTRVRRALRREQDQELWQEKFGIDPPGFAQGGKEKK